MIVFLIGFIAGMVTTLLLGALLVLQEGARHD